MDFLLQFFYWLKKNIKIYYTSFEKKFHSIMDDLEQDLEKQKKQIFAQNKEEYNSFLKNVFFCLCIGIIVWIFLLWLDYKNNNYLWEAESFLPLFHTIKFPKSHIIIFAKFPTALSDFKYRYYKPIQYLIKFDLTPKIRNLKTLKCLIDFKYRYYKPLRFVLKILPKNW